MTHSTERVVPICEAAETALDAWNPDDASETEIADLFAAIYGRKPEGDEDPVDFIYDASGSLDPEEAEAILRIIG